MKTPIAQRSAAFVRGFAAIAAGLFVVAGVGTSATASPASHDGAGPTTTVTYAGTDENIANPERGFYRHTETHYRADGSGYVPLDPTVLASYRAAGYTQIMRVFYLEKFVDQPVIDPQYLQLVQADFAAARQAGISVIVRFAYVQGGAWPYSPPYGDAPVSTVLAHIKQLGPLLRANADVIATVQSGFVGLWGEGYYTDWFAADPSNPGVLTDTDWANRRAVVEAELAELPKSITVQVRTMLMKQTILGVPTGTAGALTEAQAYSGSDLARVGHHNDCFLAAPDDWGTFLSDPLTLDQEYLAQDSRFVPVGGETCNPNPLSAWDNASATMARYHYSFLNWDYNRDVLDSWGTAGLAETARDLGYRFVLKDSTVAQQLGHGGPAATVTVRVANEGWAAPYNERDARLVLDGPRGTFDVPLADAQGRTDARWWAPGTTTSVTASVCGVPAGRYHAYLALPSQYATVAGDSRYAIRTANADTWRSDKGWNDLGQSLTVDATTSCS